jgi:hypothetical protein
MVMMGWIGTVELAAHGIALQIISVTFMVHVGLSSAATVRAGRAWGRGDAGFAPRGGGGAGPVGGDGGTDDRALDRVPRASGGPVRRTGRAVAPVIIALGAQLLIVAAFFQLADAAQVMGLGLLRGVQDTRRPMIYAVVSYWLVGCPSRISSGSRWAGARSASGGGWCVGLGLAGGLMVWRFWSGARAGGGAGRGGVNGPPCMGTARSVSGCGPKPREGLTVYAILSAGPCVLLALPALAQDLPGLREARGMVFAEDGAVSWEVIADPALTEGTSPRSTRSTRFSRSPITRRWRCRPMRGSPRRSRRLPANYHDEANARAAALAACEANRAGAGSPCIVALVIRPEGWEPGRPLQLSAQATAALKTSTARCPGAIA